MARQKTSKERSPNVTPETGGPAPEPTRGDLPPDMPQDLPVGEIPDAEIVAETPAPQLAPAPELAPELAPEMTTAAAPQTGRADASGPQARGDDLPAPDAQTAPDAAPAQPADPEPGPSAPKPAPAPQPSASILPMLLGGAVAAALGFGAHMLTQTRSGPDLQAQIATLRDTLAALPAPPPAFDPSELTARIAALEGQAPAAQDLAALAAELAALSAAQETAQDAILAAAAAQRDAQSALEAEIARLQAELADVRALATERVEAATAARDTALASAGLDQLRAALVTGAPFATAMAQIAQAGFALPDPLPALPMGVATIEALAESYTDAARAGLRASLMDAPAASTTERLGNFLRAQVGALSTSPREGQDVDAILSRAAAAMLEGDVARAVAELDALPEIARAPMAEWRAAATARLEASAALDALAAQIAP